MLMEINVVMFHEVVETMTRQMCAIIKAKGSPKKYVFFFGWAVYILMYILYVNILY